MSFQRLKTKGLVFYVLCIFIVINQPAIASVHGVMLAEVDESIVSISGTEEMEVISLLTEFSDNQLTFEQQQVSMTRGWLELSKQQNSCMFNKIKTPERLEVASFSRYPITIYPPLRLIALAKNQQVFANQLDFAKLPPNTQGQIGVVKDRSYGDYIDQKINRNPHEFYVRGGMSSSNRLVDMLKAERVLGIIEYSEVVDAYLRDNDKSLDYVSIPIRHVDQAIYGYIACSKGEKGDEIIAEIDRVMSQQSFQEAFIRMHDDFFGEAEKAILIPQLEILFNLR
ncbi:hypothetical protein L2735_12465 [Shewanella olleyana]|uniref:hypothetical protein n=1 Tax=Shewanella olleyana TaxID=135626 RepID=UPI00200E1B0C|nr:hypothetical protein [Shewanella olleyana]MCL1067611.1 hypothetical protein [Shewanella olleyana]